MKAKSRSARRAAVAAVALAGLGAGPTLAAPSYPAALDRAALSAWLVESTDIAPDQVVAVTASAAAAMIGRAERTDGRTDVMLRAVSLSPQATARAGVTAWQVKLAVDCRTGKVRAGQTLGFSSQKADGEAIPLSPEESAWRRPRPATTLDSAWRAVCDADFQPPLGEPRPQLTSLAARAPASRPVPRPAAAFASNAWAKAPAAAAAAPKPGRWVAQVVSSPEESDSRRALAGLRGRYGDALEALETRVERAEVRGRTVYRGVVAGFPSRGAASEFCAALRRDGRECLAR